MIRLVRRLFDRRNDVHGEETRRRVERPQEKLIRQFSSLREFRRSVLDRYASFPCDALEIGAFTAPTVSPNEANIKFLDCFSTTELVEKVRHSGGDPSAVVEVDYVCRDDNYVAVIKDTFDVIIANHVFEHIDHSIRWLQMMRTMLHQDGILFLVLPDKKYSFDKFRPDTPVSHLLFEYLAEGQDVSTIHNFETALYYDLGYIGSSNDPNQKLDLENLKRAIRPSHPGVHRHVFQAETFEDRLMRPLLFTGLLDFELLEVEMCKQFGEFAIVFKAGRRNTERSAGNLFQPATDTIS